MTKQSNHITLSECRDCIVLMQDTFAGVLSDRKPNNCRLKITKPIAYFQSLQKDLNDSLAKRGVKGNYTVSIKVSPKDHRTFLSAKFRYGRRVLTYTNVSGIAHTRTNETTTYCAKQSTVTATRTIKPAGSAAKWVNEHTQAWIKAGYTGKFYERETAKGLIYVGNFDHKKEDKHVKITSQYNSKKQLIFTLVQTYTVTENIYAEGNPKDFVHETRKAMKAEKFDGFINTYINNQNRLVIDGQFTKTIKVDNGTNAYVVLYYNQTERVKAAPVEGWENWKPTKQVGRSFAQVRSIVQDDEYTPQYRKGLTQHQEVQSEYHRYLKEMRLLDRVQLVQREIEYIKSQNRKSKVTKPVDQAKRWMQSVLKSNPDWFLKDNAVMLVIYCKDCIEKGVFTPAEATTYCEQNAK